MSQISSLTLKKTGRAKEDGGGEGIGWVMVTKGIIAKTGEAPPDSKASSACTKYIHAAQQIDKTFSACMTVKTFPLTATTSFFLTQYPLESQNQLFLHEVASVF